MNIKEILFEMAASHLDDAVADKMIAGDIEGAVLQYLDNIKAKKGTIAKSSSATTKKLREKKYSKSMKMSIEKAEKIPVAYWDMFDKAYEILLTGDTTIKQKERDSKKGSIAKTKTGEEVISTSGQKQKKIKDDLSQKLVTLIKEREAQLDVEEDADKLKDISDHIRALYVMLEGLSASRSGRSILKIDAVELQKRYRKISDQFRKKNMTEEVNSGELINLVDELIKETENEEEKRKYINMRRELKKILRAYKVNEDTTPFFIPSDYRTKALSEALEYEGYNIEENYLFSSFAKAFRKDVETYGNEDARDLYESMYGENIHDILDIISEDVFFNSIAGIEHPLLFEGYGLNVELTEGVWSNLLKFGGKSLSSIKKALGAGTGWAKEVLSKGVGFFVDFPIAKIAIPAVILAGGVKGAIKFINNIRKKSKLDPLGKEELEKFRDEVKNNRREINSLKW